MEKEEYIETMSKLLNGQLRGAINATARKENLELIQLTLSSIWDEAYAIAINDASDLAVLEKLKNQLKDDPDRS